MKSAAIGIPCGDSFIYDSVFLLLPLEFFFLINLFILFLAALGLRCCMQAFFSCSVQGLLFVAVRRLLIAVASLAVECRLSSCGSRALEHRLSSCGTQA